MRTSNTVLLFGILAACGTKGGDTVAASGSAPAATDVSEPTEPIDQVELPHYHLLAPTGWLRRTRPDHMTVDGKALYRLIAADHQPFTVTIQEFDITPDEASRFHGVNEAFCASSAKDTATALKLEVDGSKLADLGALRGCTLDLSGDTRGIRQILLTDNATHGLTISCARGNQPAPTLAETCDAIARTAAPTDFPGRLVRTIERAKVRLAVPPGWLLSTDPSLSTPGVDVLMQVPHDRGFHASIVIQDVVMPPEGVAALRKATVESCAAIQKAMVTEGKTAGVVKVWDQHGFHGCDIELFVNDPDRQSARNLSITDGTSVLNFVCNRDKAGDPVADAACTAIVTSATVK